MTWNMCQRAFLYRLVIGVIGLFMGCTDEQQDETLILTTTLEQTVTPVLAAEPQSGNDRSKWGVTKAGPGEPFAVRNDLGMSPPEQPAAESSSLGFFWHLTDTQISDEESPARLIKGDRLVSTAYRNQEAWSPLVLDATIRTGNAFAVDHPFDFVLMTGDLIENIHQNEIEWFITIMEGGTVNPDSGEDDNPLPNSNLAPHSPFEAEGLDRSIPWYAVIGNHDSMIMGFSNDDQGGRIADPTGDTTSSLSAAVIPTCLDKPWYDTEPKNPKRCYMPPNSFFDSPTLVADPNREYVRGADFQEYFFGTESLPDGHGLTRQNVEDGTSYYTVDGILPNVPSTLVVLETTAYVNDTVNVDATQLEWLETELAQAEQEGNIVIVASHHSSGTISNNEALVSTLQAHPNVILHIVGHSHNNRIIPWPAPVGLPVEHGYWEIETSSLVDWPQQTRIVEIVDNRDGTGSIYATMLNYYIPADRPVLNGARYYALYDVQEGYGEINTEGEPTDRNAILGFTWPRSIAESLSASPPRPVKSTQF
ncbi:MAG: hypothetical protein GY762_16945 [Proteobacteria bacterium]|nr:hypothetical protein [Pseudomonadota bacterium]